MFDVKKMRWTTPPGDRYFGPILETTPRGFEIDHLYFALRRCTRHRRAIDGGAHIGTWTVTMAEFFDQVMAFEPFPANMECLRNNLSNARMAGADVANVLLFQAALSDHDGHCGLRPDPQRPGNSGAIMVDRIPGNCIQLTIDGLNLNDLDFLKLDVEGFEIFALTGADATIRRCRPVIMVECKAFTPERNGGVNSVLRYLDDLGYSEAGGIRNDRVFIPR